jgi:hypothetical protein
MGKSKEGPFGIKAHNGGLEVTDGLNSLIVVPLNVKAPVQHAEAYRRVSNAAWRSRNEEISKWKKLLRSALKDMTTNDADNGCDCHDGQTCSWEKHLALVGEIQRALK